MGQTPPPSPARLRRLAEELDEAGLAADGRPTASCCSTRGRPARCGRRCTSGGWRAAAASSTRPPTRRPGRPGARLAITRGPVGELPLTEVRPLRRRPVELADPARPTAPTSGRCSTGRPGSERDLVVLAEVLGRHARAAPPDRARCGSSAPFGVLRWDGLALAPRAAGRALDRRGDGLPGPRRPRGAQALLEFAVHDLGSRGIGATARSTGPTTSAAGLEPRLPTPPPLRHPPPGRPRAAAPRAGPDRRRRGVRRRRHARQLGVRLVPSPEAEVGGRRLPRHAPHSARRYSYDDPARHGHRRQRGRPRDRAARRRPRRRQPLGGLSSAPAGRSSARPCVAQPGLLRVPGRSRLRC